ncbi:MAG: FtsX-like permease family protein [Sporichthyaceae bacterium]
MTGPAAGGRATTLRLAVAGLWFRRSTALIVLVLATVASAASVVAPLYSRAAEESIVRDTLRRADAFTLSVQVSVPQSGAGVGFGAAKSGSFEVDTMHQVLTHPAFGVPRLSYSGKGSYSPTAGPFRGGQVVGQVVEREGACERFTLAAGRCPTAADEGVVTRRSLALIGARLGDAVHIELPGSATIEDLQPPQLDVTVVGTFDPVPVQSPYWAGRPYFSSYYPQSTPKGLGEAPPTADPVFVGPGGARLARITTYSVDVPVLPGRVRLDDATALRQQIRRLGDVNTRYQLTTYSQLPAALARADDGRELVRIAAPLAVTQLVLLSWWTLFLVVGAATEERSPELGLAKLRGLTARQTRRFGLAEVLLLLLVAAPLGTLIGYLAVRGAAPRVFAPGTQVVLTWTVLLTVLGTVFGGVVTAALSSRQVFNRPVSELLRRVPPRRAGRRAGLVEGVVLVLAVAGVVQLVNDRGSRPSPVALLAPGMVAVTGGLLAARVLVRVARRRTARALDRGHASGAVGWAGVARRPGTARIASVLAVATCLLLVGVQAWTVAERNRHERAGAETGAEVVLQVRAPSHRSLLDAVRAADPEGRYAMAAVQVTTSSQEAQLLAVDSARADRILDWGAPGAWPDDPVARVLHPDLPPPVRLGAGRLVVGVDLRSVRTPSPLRLTAQVDEGGTVERVDLGTLRRGARTYAVDLPAGCTADGCRLVSLAVDHPGTDIESATAELVLRSLALAPPGGAPADLPGTFGAAGAWRPGAPTVGGPELRLTPGDGGLAVTLRAPGGPFAEIVRGDSPEPLPAYVGAAVGAAADSGTLPVEATTGLAGAATRYSTTHPTAYLPRLGRDAALVDLDLALRLDEDAALGDREVWLSRDDPRAEAALRRSLRQDDVTVLRRETRGALERVYAGDGAVLALRLLLVCGGAAVVVAVGALLVAAYVGRRQRAYEVAALRVVGVRRRTVRALLLRENVGTVLVALVCGAAAALVATWVVLPALPQFDDPSAFVEVRYVPDAPTAWAAVGGLGLLLVGVGLAVAVLQLRSGRPDRLREGVR